MTLSKAIFAAVLLAAVSSTPGLAQKKDDSGNQGTSEEQAACRRDTRKFCRHLKPDEGSGAFLSCLQDNRKKLSKACNAVLESHNL
jgi:hypothetical protein